MIVRLDIFRAAIDVIQATYQSGSRVMVSGLFIGPPLPDYSKNVWLSIMQQSGRVTILPIKNLTPNMMGYNYLKIKDITENYNVLLTPAILLKLGKIPDIYPNIFAWYEKVISEEQNLTFLDDTQYDELVNISISIINKCTSEKENKNFTFNMDSSRVIKILDADFSGYTGHQGIFHLDNLMYSRNSLYNGQTRVISCNKNTVVSEVRNFPELDQMLSINLDNIVSVSKTSFRFLNIINNVSVQFTSIRNLREHNQAWGGGCFLISDRDADHPGQDVQVILIEPTYFKINDLCNEIDTLLDIFDKDVPLKDYFVIDKKDFLDEYKKLEEFEISAIRKDQLSGGGDMYFTLLEVGKYGIYLTGITGSDGNILNVRTVTSYPAEWDNTVPCQLLDTSKFTFVVRDEQRYLLEYMTSQSNTWSDLTITTDRSLINTSLKNLLFRFVSSSTTCPDTNITVPLLGMLFLDSVSGRRTLFMLKTVDKDITNHRFYSDNWPTSY
jgi:hypothetical protein